MDKATARIVNDGQTRSVIGMAPVLNQVDYPISRPPQPESLLEPGEWVWKKPGYELLFMQGYERIKKRDRKTYMRDYRRQRRAEGNLS